MQTIDPLSEKAADPLGCGVVWPRWATDMPPSTTARTLALDLSASGWHSCGCPISPFGKISVPGQYRIDNLLKVDI